MFARASSFVAVACLALTACAVSPAEDEGASSAKSAEVRGDCDLVRCPMPLCADGQHLAYQGSCCPTCVGRPSKCALVLCAAVACGEGEQLVTSPGDCCGHCVKAPKAAECKTNEDCPQFACIRCPCPVSECVGRKCITRTPDESTCGGGEAL